MICATGSVLPYRNRIHDRHPEAYYNAALQYLGPQFLTRGLESVQDLLLICRFGIYHPIGRSHHDCSDKQLTDNNKVRLFGTL